MDEGTAALITAFAGMVGALGGAVAGAFGAIRGAKVGAEKIAESTRQHIEDQATVERAHWLREQRRTIYEEFIAAALIVREKAHNALDTPVDEDIDNVHDATYDLNNQLSRIVLLGPESIDSAASELVDKVWILNNRIYRVAVAPNDDCDRRDIAIDEMVTAWEDFNRLYGEFVRTARNMLEAGSQ